MRSGIAGSLVLWHSNCTSVPSPVCPSRSRRRFCTRGSSVGSQLIIVIPANWLNRHFDCRKSSLRTTSSSCIGLPHDLRGESKFSFYFNLDQHAWINESAYFDHGGARADTAKKLMMGAAVLFPT